MPPLSQGVPSMEPMAGNGGWSPLVSPGARQGRQAFTLSPFTRLARTHAAAAAGDGSVAVALAGSLFFSASLDQAKWRVVLYLVLTLAPFSIVAPLIGPAIDRARGGARWIIVGTCAARCVVALLMVSHIDTVLLFPEAFAMLVMGKGYHVAKSAYLPTTVGSDEELVAANSKLALLSALSATVGAAPTAAAAQLGGAAWAIAVAMVWFGVATVCSTRVPAPAAPPIGAPSPQEQAELHSGGVRLASSAMGLLRGASGFLSFWVAFELRARHASPVEFAIVLAPIGVGAIVGSALAPRARRVLAEEHMLLAAVGLTAVAGAFSALIGGLAGASLIAGVVALVSASAKQAFDALVQRDAPNADHGRAFATYEARFQILWVIGALSGVLLPLPLRVGFAIVGAFAAGAGLLFFLGRRALARGAQPVRLTDWVLRFASEPAPAPATVQDVPSSTQPRLFDGAEFDTPDGAPAEDMPGRNDGRG